jgi:hypothetical protein
MFVNKDQIQNGIIKYIDAEIGGKATGGAKFITYFAMPIVIKKANQLIDNFSTNELTKELFDANKNLNIDEVYGMAKNAVQKSGQFTYLGMIFNETDIDKLYSYIRG